MLARPDQLVMRVRSLGPLHNPLGRLWREGHDGLVGNDPHLGVVLESDVHRRELRLRAPKAVPHDGDLLWAADVGRVDPRKYEACLHERLRHPRHSFAARDSLKHGVVRLEHPLVCTHLGTHIPRGVEVSRHLHRPPIKVLAEFDTRFRNVLGAGKCENVGVPRSELDVAALVLHRPVRRTNRSQVVAALDSQLISGVATVFEKRAHRKVPAAR
mmetsp:Transcript_41671/g.138105  ORF Transcript_41671/g.138105 Transcript_41671/m.138105 type:complete len:214 (-) Transcript_41671:350-991(-)